MLSLSYQILIFPCHIFYQPPSFINRDSPTKAMNAKGFLILIHAPHARSDHCFGPIVMETGISIHAPHARSDCQIPRPYKQRDSDQFSANPKKINIITAFMHIYIMFGTGSR